MLIALAFLLCSGWFSTSAWAARSRPHLDTSLGYNVILSDSNTLLRGVSLSWDGGDPYGSQSKVMPTQAKLNALATTYGLNTLHLYLEGDSAGANGNNNPIGYNAADCDILVQRCADAGLYLIITIGCNGKNGQMNLAWSTNFWNFYGPRYKDQTHVIYEAHNEPASNSLWTWSANDWNNQIALYNTIRSVAPDTFILLCSFMGFAGDNNINSVYDPRNRANYLAANGVSWANAGMAYHGYESDAGIETAISLIQSSTNYPALLCTEFWPGDTYNTTKPPPNGRYNSMFESHFNGWMQFQWLGANDNDLSGTDGFKEKINNAGTVWTPDVPTCNWPAKGAPTTIPAHNSSVGIYDRGVSRFVRINGSGNLVADLTNYTGTQGDKFTLERSSMNLISLRATNGLYVRTISQTDSLTANSATAGVREKFQWIELATGPVVLRAFGGGGHLLRSTNNLILPNADNGLSTSTHYTFVDGTTPSGPPSLPTTLPSPWVTADIGAVGVAGSAVYGDGVFTVAGSGADIESNADAFRYVYQAANGDVTIVARLATQQNTDFWAKTGVMIREGTNAGSRNAAVLMTPGGGVVFQRRTSTGGSTASTQASGVVVPRWVKLVRTGNSFSAYHSADGVAWTQIGTSQTNNMATSATLGLAVTSHADGTLCTSTMDNVLVLGLPPQPTGLSATAGNNQVTLTWNASAGATSYNVKRATVNGGPYTNTNLVTGLTFTNTGLVNGTPYYYVVSAVNGVGESANSSQVSATPTNRPPVLAPIPDQTILSGRTLVVTNSASDADGPPQTLTYSLLNAPAGTSIGTSSGVFTWRPTIAQSSATQTVNVVVSDNGVPVMSTTQSFQVAVVQPVIPTCTAVLITNGCFGFWVDGDVGPDYTVLASTNLTSWSPVFTTNSPTLPFNFVTSMDTAVSGQFYRIQLGPE